MIGLIGLGRFGRLAVNYLVKDHQVCVYTPSGRFDEIEALGAKPVSFAEACIQETVLFCVPISKFAENVEYAAPFIRPGALVVDVCSVKEYPVACMRKALPEHAQILATHPMFGPDSAATSLQGAKMVLCPERIDRNRYHKIKNSLEAYGLKIIETTPEIHDRETARSLALPHFIGRAMEVMGLAPVEIDTEGFKRLLHVMGVVTHDTWQLFMDMQTYNRFAAITRSEFVAALKKVEDRINE